MICNGKKHGMQIDEELPGIDRPDLVDALYKKVDDWLVGNIALP